jgi:Na+-driven multidrug efflux pump
VLVFWLFVRKDTYISLSTKAFHYSRDVTWDILRVGIPSSAEFLLMAILSGIMNGILVVVAGPEAVAVYTAGWRVVFVAIIPVIALSTAVIPVAGAAYGARNYEKLSVAHMFSMQIGFAISIAISAVTWFFAPWITSIYTYTEASAYLAPTIALFLQTMCLFYPAAPLSIMSSAVFQATGKGMTSLAINLLRNLVFIALFAWIFAIYLGFGEQGAWWGIVAGNIMAGIISIIWARLYISRLRATHQSS